jgi:dihydrodipicolinate synthase/N-acetylneuraminate lyase
MIALGATGEAAQLNDEESRRVLETALESADYRKVMIAGIACDSLQNTLQSIDFAAVKGYDGTLISLPATRLSAQEQRTYLQMVADRSPLPLILTGDITVNLILGLAFHPQVFGFLGDFEDSKAVESLRKETATSQRTVTVTHLFRAVTRRMSSMQTTALISAADLASSNPMPLSAGPTLKMRQKTVSFQVLTGRTASLLESLKAGAAAAAPLFAAAAPQAVYEVMAAWKDGDPALAEQKQQRLNEAIRLIEGGLAVAGIKYGCDLNGYFGGNPRLPRLPLTAKQRAEIERLMQGLRS